MVRQLTSTNRSERVVRLGVLGCADIATRRILPAVADIEEIAVVAVASRDREKAERTGARFGCSAIIGYENLLNRQDIDAVYIPLPPGLHYQWVAAAIQAGKHVLVEKPACTNYRHAEELVQLARAAGVVLAENFMFLHHSQHAEIQSIVEEGAAGAVQVFASSFGVPPLNPNSFRYRPDLGGGALLDVGVYPLRAAQLYFQDELEVLSASLRIDAETGVDVAGSAMLGTPTGVVAHLDFGFQHAYQSTYSLWGDKGRISTFRAFTPPEQLKPQVRIEQQDRCTELALPADHQVRNALAAFAAAVRVGGPSHALERLLLRQAMLVQRIREVARIVGSEQRVRA